MAQLALERALTHISLFLLLALISVTSVQCYLHSDNMCAMCHTEGPRGAKGRIMEGERE